MNNKKLGYHSIFNQVCDVFSVSKLKEVAVMLQIFAKILPLAYCLYGGERKACNVADLSYSRLRD